MPSTPFCWSIPTRISIPTRRPPPRWPTSWAITITPSWPIRPACRGPSIEEPGLGRREKVGRLVEWLAPLDNTIQVQLAHRDGRRHSSDFATSAITPTNWEAALRHAAGGDGPARLGSEVLARSKLEAVFLTNDFDDPLEGFDTSTYVPCLRTDDLVFHLGQPAVRERLERATRQLRSATSQSLAGRSASCSSISSLTAPGRAPFRCRPILRRCKVDGRPPRRLRRRMAARAAGRRGSERGDAGAFRLLDAWPSIAPSSSCRSI